MVRPYPDFASIVVVPCLRKKLVLAKDSSKREEMFKKSNGAKTVPQVFIGEHHVGGNAELQTLDKSGKLDTLLNT